MKNIGPVECYDCEDDECLNWIEDKSGELLVLCDECFEERMNDSLSSRYDIEISNSDDRIKSNKEASL